jgi:excisionase family DNA binding protein
MNSNGNTLSTDDVADRLGVDRATVARWIRKGQFPNAFKKGPAINSPYVIPESDVDAFVKSLKTQKATDSK